MKKPSEVFEKWWNKAKSTSIYSCYCEEDLRKAFERGRKFEKDAIVEAYKEGHRKSMSAPYNTHITTNWNI